MAEAFVNIHNPESTSESVKNPVSAPNAVPSAATGGATVRRTSTRGFASMDPSKQKEIARKGGRAAHMKGTAHEFTPEEARSAGRKGGEAVSRDRAHMAQIGREGGQARGARAALRHQEMRANEQRIGENAAVGQSGGERGGFGADTGAMGNADKGGFHSGSGM